MTPTPLRNACNAPPSIRIHLEMSLAESQQARHALTQLLPSTHLGLEAHQTLHHLLAQIGAAIDQALHRSQCPVCQQWFAQGASGRRAQYCSAACKQKAYRQRQNARRRLPPGTSPPASHPKGAHLAHPTERLSRLPPCPQIQADRGTRPATGSPLRAIADAVTPP